jgi:DNA mismatch endonuclease, patch repair protein
MQRIRVPRFETASSPTASRILSATKSIDTKCEMQLRSVLWRMGLRFRKNVRDLPGKPDIVFTKQRVAVFCDGDFWHGRDWPARKRRLHKGANALYWTKKIGANIQRDRLVDKDLEGLGWKVLRLWESDILEDPYRCALEVERVVQL